MRAINKTIAQAIIESIGGEINGNFSVEVEADDTLIMVDGSFEIDGYREDDYFNGTGAYIVTDVHVNIDNVAAYNEDGDEIEIDCDTLAIEKEVEKRLAA